MNVAVFKLKKNKINQWKEWCGEINGHLKEEALKTLREVNVNLEAAYLFNDSNEYYLIGIMAFSGKPKHANAVREINQQHKHNKKTCFERRLEVNELYKLVVSNDND